MHYTDKYLAQKLHKAVKVGTASNQLRAAIIKYWQEIVELNRTGKIDRETACYHIADVMFIKVVENDPILEDLSLEAGELELPKHHISGDVESRWKDLQATIMLLA